MKLSILVPRSILVLREEHFPAVLQLDAAATHRFPQEFLHALQPGNLLIDLAMLLPRQPQPSCGGWDVSLKAVEKRPDLRNAESGFSSEFDYGQLELGIGRESSLSALPGSPWKDSRPFIKPDRGAADSRFTCKFADLHVRRSSWWPTNSLT